MRGPCTHIYIYIYTREGAKYLLCAKGERDRESAQEREDSRLVPATDPEVAPRTGNSDSIRERCVERDICELEIYGLGEVGLALLRVLQCEQIIDNIGEGLLFYDAVDFALSKRKSFICA